jgi:glycosyltransferase involved in cell wall biosynthesis
MPSKRAQATTSKIIFPILSISWHGGTRVLIQIANYLAGIGYSVEFLVSRNRCDTPFEFLHGVSVKHVGVYTRLKIIDYLIFLCCVPFHVSRTSILVASFFVTYFPVRVLAFIKSLPYIYFVQDIESKYPFPRGVLLNILCNWTYKDKRIVAANKYLRGRLLREYGTYSRYISVGPDSIFFDLPSQAPKKYDVLYFLRGEPWKGLDRFDRFLSLARGQLACLCVSQDDLLAKKIAETSATFRKPESDRDLIQCIDSARVLLLTSYREGFSLPPLEGMARGLPTVLFRCGGPDQYINHGHNALYVESEEEAVRAVEALIGDSTIYERMREQAILTAEEYRMDKSLVAFADYIADCANW